VAFDVTDSSVRLSHIYKGFDKEHKAVNYIREMNAVTAACMLVRKNLFLNIGMFDEGFLNGYEDVDFCLRVREMGNKIIYNSESELYHYEETTEGRLLYGERNDRHFLSKWQGKIKPDLQDKLKEDGFRHEYTPEMRCVYISIAAEEDNEGKNKNSNCSCNNKDRPATLNAEDILGRDTSALKKVAIIRGANLNQWEMQNYESLQGSFDITAYATNQTIFDISNINLPVIQLPFKHQGLLMEMEGLEDSLADKDLVFSADITFKFSAQAVNAKQKSGCKIVCLEWENIPYIYEEYEEVHHIKETVRNGADHFIAVTERAKEALMIEGVPEEKIDVIPMGVDLNVFRPVQDGLEAERRKLGINEDDMVVLFIGRMVWEKGIYDFLHAAARICRDNMFNEKRIRYLIVGKGPELEGARERAGVLGISSSTIFIEEYPYEDMYKLHNIADFFVLPSISTRTWQEQFGMVLIESMACGTPVISTYSGSIPEVVGEGGVLVQPNDHLSLYQAIKELITNKDTLDDLAQKALKRAETLFDSAKTADKVKAVFNKVMSRKTEAEMNEETHAKGVAYWEQGKKEKAFSMVCEIFGKDPDNKNVLNSIFKMGMELEKYETVEKSIKEYLQCHPANLEALALMAEILICLGKREQAKAELKKIMIFDPQNGIAKLLLNQIEEKKNSVKQLS
jgi:glycosyltransferase involved in cell wall biosynthesis